MSGEKEEIRWELDKIFEFVDWLIHLHSNEQKTFWVGYEKLHSSSIKGRNSIIAGIAFVIGVIVSLVSIGELERDYVDFLAYGFVGAAIVFIGTNVLLYFIGKRYLLLNEAYQNDIEELLELKGWLLGASIKDKPNKEQIMFLTKLTYVISQVISYNMRLKAHNLFKQDLPELNEFQRVFQTAKENLVHYKKMDLKIVKTIEKFVEEFEKP